MDWFTFKYQDIIKNNVLGVMDFLGSTTPTDLVASVTQGVQDTGVALWPLVTFVGIGLAFTIFGFVVSIIRKSVGGRK